jgi:hypothetical protein
MEPMLLVQVEGPVTDQVTVLAKLPVPATVAVNCTWVPMVAVAGFGVTVTDVIVGPVGGGGPTPPPPPPQPDSTMFSPIPIQNIVFHAKVLMSGPLRSNLILLASRLPPAEAP